MKTILMILALSLIGCSTSTTTQNSEPEYKVGEKFCFVTGSFAQTVIIKQDMFEDQTTMIVEMKDGSLRMVDVEYLIDHQHCGLN